MSYKRCCVSLLLLFVIIPARAQPPVDTLYRLDNRPPQDIINAGGFHPWRHPRDGGDTDLIRHLEGTSVNAHTTGFVSTSDRLEGSINIAAFIAGWDFPRYDLNYRVFLYRIRPDPANAYRVSLSVQHAVDHTDRQDRERALVRLHQLLLEDQYEVAVLGGIPSDRIIAYTEITGAMLMQYPRAELTSPLFWAHRWTYLDTYNRAYDCDRVMEEPYPEHLMSDPTGGAYSLVSVSAEHAEDPEWLALDLSCFGFPSSLLYYSASTCGTHTNVVYHIYSDALKLFLTTRYLLH